MNQDETRNKALKDKMEDLVDEQEAAEILGWEIEDLRSENELFEPFMTDDGPRYIRGLLLTWVYEARDEFLHEDMLEWLCIADVLRWAEDIKELHEAVLAFWKKTSGIADNNQAATDNSELK